MMETLVDSFDIWGIAQTQKSLGKKAGIDNISLHGVNRLRELILELAVRGKLVPQDSNDEPASVLLKKIEAENKKLIEQGKFKKQKSLPGITEEDKPYKLPQGWKFVRLGEIISISSGDGLTANQMDEDGNIPVFGGNGINGYHNLWNVEKKTLVIGRVGYYCGSIHITPQKAWVTDNAFITSVSENNIELEFLYWLLTGTNLKENENATAQPVISGRKIYPIVVGLPPKNEQHHIAAKVDELMALCDQLEQQQMNHIETHLKLVDVLLQTLTSATSAEELKAAWQHLEPHFDILFTTEESIDLLKQTILQLAVMGKLVPQDKNDEPASELLKNLSKEDIENAPFKLPSSWQWCKFDEVAWLRHGHQFRKYDFVEDGIPVVKIGQCKSDGTLDLSQCDFISPDRVTEFEDVLIKKGDLLMALTGGTLGKVTRVDKDYGIIVQNYRVGNFFTNDSILSLNYLNVILESELFQGLVKEKINQNAQPNIGKDNIEKILMPIAPLSEQHRIVERVKELMILCDQLNERIVASQQLKVKLADAVVEQTVN